MVTVHYNETETFQFAQDSLSNLETEMTAYGFFRNHKSYLVALSFIESVTYDQITLRDKSMLPISCKKYTALKERLISNWEQGA